MTPKFAVGSTVQFGQRVLRVRGYVRVDKEWCVQFADDALPGKLVTVPCARLESFA